MYNCLDEFVVKFLLESSRGGHKVVRLHCHAHMYYHLLAKMAHLYYHLLAKKE